jgi:HEPN domain-containing protein
VASWRRAGRTAFARAWLEQAEADLRAAEISASGGAYEWACFQSQQAGEKALNAYLYARGYARGLTSIMTHSLRRLVQECQAFDPPFGGLAEAERFLDQHYIATRYPNGLDVELPPTRYYEDGDAEACLRCARSILARVMPFFAS